tara:strand:+ start:1088 stop:1690 length:603 start_codon:yes stop_codon:yes gene_type:complete
MSSCNCSVEIESKAQRKVLLILLAINATMFVVELSIGFIAESTGLIADSLDMLADATVYGIGIYAVCKASSTKTNAAYISGVFQILLSVAVGVDIVRRFYLGSDPESLLMISVGIVALIANTICLMLISKHKDGEIHMRASWIFSKNDVIANVGVILAGILVLILDSRWPDLLIGTIIVIVVFRGGWRIIKLARNELQKN